MEACMTSRLFVQIRFGEGANRGEVQRNRTNAARRLPARLRRGRPSQDEAADGNPCQLPRKLLHFQKIRNVLFKL